MAKAVDSSQNARGWQQFLVVVGIALILASAGLQLVISRFHSTTTVTKHAGTTVTTTGPSAPPATLVTSVLAAGVISLFAAAFFSKINKIVIPGLGELDLDSQTAIAGKAAAATNDPETAKQLVKKTNDKVLSAVQKSPVMTTPTTDVINQAFQEAARDLGVDLPAGT